jgi:uncharacterized protein (TIGR03435 family)
MANHTPERQLREEYFFNIRTSMTLNLRLLDSLPPFLLFALLLFCIPAATAQSATSPSFEVASVRPSAPEADPQTGSWSLPGIGRFTATHVSLALLMKLAYGVDDSQIANKPGWLETNLYDIAAEPEDGIKLSRDQLRPRLQNLLRQRFHLVAHTETRSIRGYALVVAKGGPHLTPTRADHFPGWRFNVSSGHMRGANWTMPQFAIYLTPAAGFPVVDQTGITGSYDIAFNYNPKPEVEGDLPILDAALKQATGLLLKERKVPVETIVIDSVDKVPTEN